MFLNSAKSLKKYPHRTLKAYDLNLTLKAVRLLAGVITEQQGKSVSQLLATEVVSLQELVCNEFVSSVAKIIGSCEEILQAVVGGLTYKNDENFAHFRNTSY